MNSKPVNESGVESFYEVDEELQVILSAERSFQQSSLNLTAACNYLSASVSTAMPPELSNIHCEGYPGNRYHQGQQNADAIERLAIERACRLFDCEHANVQPYRGTQANLAACVASVASGNTILGFASDAGGHFSTGSDVHILNRLFNVVTYSLDPVTYGLDYDRLLASARSVCPAAIIAGDTAWPGEWDWQRMREIADCVGAVLIVDISQTAGLIAAGVLANPCGLADIATMATYKTLRGPRAGIILCKMKYADQVDRAVFPVCQDGTNVQLLSGLAAALFEASSPAFRRYSQTILANSYAMAAELNLRGYRLITGGTRNHACLIDVSDKGMSGRECAETLSRVNIIANANQIPNDSGPPKNPSGLRLGTAAVTTAGLNPEHMPAVVSYVDRALVNRHCEGTLSMLRDEVTEFRKQFPGVI